MIKMKSFDEWLQDNDQHLYQEIWGSNTIKKGLSAIKKAAAPLAVAGGMALGGQANAPEMNPQQLDSHSVLQQLNAAMDKGDHQLASKLVSQLGNSIDSELNGLQGKMDGALDASGKTMAAASDELTNQVQKFNNKAGIKPESEVDQFIRQTNQPDAETEDFIRNVGGRK